MSPRRPRRGHRRRGGDQPRCIQRPRPARDRRRPVTTAQPSRSAAPRCPNRAGLGGRVLDVVDVGDDGLVDNRTALTRREAKDWHLARGVCRRAVPALRPGRTAMGLAPAARRRGTGCFDSRLPHTTLSLAAAPGPAVAAATCSGGGRQPARQRRFHRGILRLGGGDGDQHGGHLGPGLPVDRHRPASSRARQPAQHRPRPRRSPSPPASPITGPSGQVRQLAAASPAPCRRGVGATAANGATDFTAGPNRTQINVAFNRPPPTTAPCSSRSISEPRRRRLPRRPDHPPQLVSQLRFHRGTPTWRRAARRGPAWRSSRPWGCPGHHLPEASPGPANQPNIAQAVPATTPPANNNSHGFIWVKFRQRRQPPLGTLARGRRRHRRQRGHRLHRRPQRTILTWPSTPPPTTAPCSSNSSPRPRRHTLPPTPRPPPSSSQPSTSPRDSRLAGGDGDEHMAVISALGSPAGTTDPQASPGPANQPNIAQAAPVTVTAGQSYHGSIWVEVRQLAPASPAPWPRGASAPPPPTGPPTSPPAPTGIKSTWPSTPPPTTAPCSSRSISAAPAPTTSSTPRSARPPPPVTGMGPHRLPGPSGRRHGDRRGLAGHRVGFGLLHRSLQRLRLPDRRRRETWRRLLAHDSKDFWLLRSARPSGRRSTGRRGTPTDSTAGQNAAR